MDLRGANIYSLPTAVMHPGYHLAILPRGRSQNRVIRDFGGRKQNGKDVFSEQEDGRLTRDLGFTGI